MIFFPLFFLFQERFLSFLITLLLWGLLLLLLLLYFFVLDGHCFVYALGGNILNLEETNSKMSASLCEHSLIIYMLHIKSPFSSLEISNSYESTQCFAFQMTKNIL